VPASAKNSSSVSCSQECSARANTSCAYFDEYNAVLGITCYYSDAVLSVQHHGTVNYDTMPQPLVHVTSTVAAVTLREAAIAE
jgi:hypothetical protein